MITILHISDLHFVKDADSYNMEHILVDEAAAEVRNMAQGEKLLVVTGDFHNFSENDYVRAEKLLKKLVEEMDLDMKQDVFVIPGNHDVGNDYLLNACLTDDPKWKNHNKAAVKMLKEGDMGFLEERLRAFKPYCSFVQEVGIYDRNLGNYYPATVHVRSWRGKLNFLHLNTALIADGSCKTDQMTDINTAAADDTWENAMDDSTPAIAIGHNSFFDIEKNQRTELEAVFARKNVSAYLCGDTHQINLDLDKQVIPLESGLSANRESIPNIVCAKSVADMSDTYSDFGYYWHRWDEKTDKVTLQFRRWRKDLLNRTNPEGAGNGYQMRGNHFKDNPGLVHGELNKLLRALDFSEDDVKLFFDRLVEEHPDVRSYDFVCQIHRFFLPREKKSILLKQMREILEKDLCHNSDGLPTSFLDLSTAKRDFAIYYCLGLYSKRQKKVESGDICLKTLLDRYNNLFSNFPLHKEVEAWYYRRKAGRVSSEKDKRQNLSAAEKCDREMMSVLPITMNAGVYCSFASTVSQKLEYEFKHKGTSLWETEETRLKDWENACSFIPCIIDCYKKTWKVESGYGKHHFIGGKLYLFAPRSTRIDKDARKKQIEQAKSELYGVNPFSCVI